MIDLEKIVAVSGQGSLFKLINTRGNGLILEDLSTNKTNFYSSRIYQFSPLDTIGIYTMTDTLPLKDVYELILRKKSEYPIPEANGEDAQFKEYFKSVLPEYDPYRVHVKDMKKAIKWFRQLKELELIKIEL
ncbi:MAG: DUF5606 domain-containing protein [Bacteroidota bacterium]|nr:DUF5606 domain-containing protein [Bacteroidota bacterium]